MKNKYLVEDYCCSDRHMWNEYSHDGYPRTGGATNFIARDISLHSEHDFDRMQDVVRLHARGFPVNDMKRSEIKPRKHVITLVLPNRGTSERDGADAIIAAFCSLLNSLPGD